MVKFKTIGEIFGWEPKNFRIVLVSTCLSSMGWIVWFLRSVIIKDSSLLGNDGLCGKTVNLLGALGFTGLLTIRWWFLSIFLLTFVFGLLFSRGRIKVKLLRIALMNSFSGLVVAFVFAVVSAIVLLSVAMFLIWFCKLEYNTW